MAFKFRLNPRGKKKDVQTLKIVARATSLDFGLVSLLLTLNRYLFLRTTGIVSINYE